MHSCRSFHPFPLNYQSGSFCNPATCAPALMARGRSAANAGALCSFDASMLPAHRNASLPLASHLRLARPLLPFSAAGNLPSPCSKTTAFCRASCFDVPSLPRPAGKYEPTIPRLLMSIDRRWRRPAFDSLVSDHLQCRVQSCASAKSNACCKLAVVPGCVAMSFSSSWMASFVFS